MAVPVFSRTGRQLQRYNNKGCRQVVGCIPYRFKKTLNGSQMEELEVLLISSQKCSALFFPKGGWEMDETKEEAALRESQEEAGVIGIVEHELGIWRFKSKSQPKFHEGYMLPLLVTEQLDVWPEKNARKRVWMSVNEAREICSHAWMKEALDVLVHRLFSLRQCEEEEEEEERTPSCALGFLMPEDNGSGNARQIEEENRTSSSCALEFLRIEDSRRGIVCQHGEDGVVGCCIS